MAPKPSTKIFSSEMLFLPDLGVIRTNKSPLLNLYPLNPASGSLTSNLVFITEAISTPLGVISERLRLQTSLSTVSSPQFKNNRLLRKSNLLNL